MTVQVESQPVTDQITWYIDMCCINNSISCLEKKTTVRKTLSDMLCPPQTQSKFHCVFVYQDQMISIPKNYSWSPDLCDHSRACFYTSSTIAIIAVDGAQFKSMLPGKLYGRVFEFFCGRFSSKKVNVIETNNFQLSLFK